MQEFQSFLINNKEVVLIISLWELIWKGFGLWKSAQKKEKVWFVAILVLNTLGFLPITYLLIEKYKIKK